MGYFDFYEGASGTQDLLASVSDRSERTINLKKGGFDNDEARSVVLRNVRAGAKLVVWDNPSGKTDDDWCEIEVKQQVQQYVVESFEHNVDDDVVKVTYHRDNGLDGKVSRIYIGTV